jgi:hypothetical protein
MNRFHLAGLAPGQFSHLFELGDQDLLEQGVRRVVANAKPGFPCRVSLSDAEIGDELLLLPYMHLAANSPYRASGPIFIRKGVQQRIEPPGCVPPYVATRLISLRGYDDEHMMVHAEVVEGRSVADSISRVLENADVDYIHLHNAKHGCFFCQVERA